MYRHGKAVLTVEETEVSSCIVGLARYGRRRRQPGRYRFAVIDDMLPSIPAACWLLEMGTPCANVFFFFLRQTAEKQRNRETEHRST